MRWDMLYLHVKVWGMHNNQPTLSFVLDVNLPFADLLLTHPILFVS